MAPTAENSQAIVDALAYARDALIDARSTLLMAKARSAMDYPHNADGIENLPGTVQVLIDAVCREHYTWTSFNDSRQREIGVSND